MIIKRTRFHTIRPQDYESTNMGASVEIDTSDPEYADLTLEDITSDLDGTLDALLANDVERALALPGEYVTTSHLNDFYPEPN